MMKQVRNGVSKAHSHPPTRSKRLMMCIQTNTQRVQSTNGPKHQSTLFTKRAVQHFCRAPMATHKLFDEHRAGEQREPSPSQGTLHPTTWSMTAKIWFRTPYLIYLAPRLPLESKREAAHFQGRHGGLTQRRQMFKH